MRAASATVVRIRPSVDTVPIAEGELGIGAGAVATRAPLTVTTRPSAGPTVVRIGADVDAIAAAERKLGVRAHTGAALAALPIATGPPTAPAVVRAGLHVDTGPVAERLPRRAGAAPAAAGLTAHANPAADATVAEVRLQAHAAPITGGQRVRAGQHTGAPVALDAAAAGVPAAPAVVRITLSVGTGPVAEVGPLRWAGTASRSTDLTAEAALAAGAAVLGIALEVGTRTAAEGQPRGTARPGGTAALPVAAALPRTTADGATANRAGRTTKIIAALAAGRTARQGTKALAPVELIALTRSLEAAVVREPVGEAALVHALRVAAGEGIGERGLSLVQTRKGLVARTRARRSAGRGCDRGRRQEAGQLGEEGGREGAAELAQHLSPWHSPRQIARQGIEVK